MSYSVTYTVDEKYNLARNEISLRVSIKGFKTFRGKKIRFTAFPPQDKTFTKTGALTFTASGKPGQNSLEIVDPDTSKILQEISSINSKMFLKGDKNQEITIKHNGPTAYVEIKKVPELEETYLRIDAHPQITLFFGMNEETNKPIFTKKTNNKGSIKTEITGKLSFDHEIKILTAQNNKICSINPPLQK
ncbi:MAG: hypothetical protein U9O98_03090 [Asgard group archaeon]|nr:hypothetical protein [Asgard group archaeon]